MVVFGCISRSYELTFITSFCVRYLSVDRLLRLIFLGHVLQVATGAISKVELNIPSAVYALRKELSTQNQFICCLSTLSTCSPYIRSRSIDRVATRCFPAV